MTSELPGVAEGRGGRANGECAYLRGSHTAEWTDTGCRQSGPPLMRRDAAMGQDGHAFMASAETSRNSFSVAPLAD